MDRNSITGILLIAAIMLGWMYFSAPSAEDLAKQKHYQDSVALILFGKDSTAFGVDLETEEDVYNTKDFYFEPQQTSFSVSGTQKKVLAMRLNAGPGKYVEFEYSLGGNEHMVHCNVNLVG